MTPDGRLLRFFRHEDGFAEANPVNSLYLDRKIVFGHEHIDAEFVELPPAEQLGVPGQHAPGDHASITQLSISSDTLYAATDLGVYQLQPTPHATSRFGPLPSLPSDCFRSCLGTVACYSEISEHFNILMGTTLCLFARFPPQNLWRWLHPAKQTGLSIASRITIWQGCGKMATENGKTKYYGTARLDKKSLSRPTGQCLAWQSSSGCIAFCPKHGPYSCGSQWPVQRIASGVQLRHRL